MMATGSSSSRKRKRVLELAWVDVIHRLSLAKGVPGKVMEIIKEDESITPLGFLELTSETQALLVERWGITGWAPALVREITEVSHSS